MKERLTSIIESLGNIAREGRLPRTDAGYAREVERLLEYEKELGAMKARDNPADVALLAHVKRTLQLQRVALSKLRSSNVETLHAAFRLLEFYRKGRGACIKAHMQGLPGRVPLKPWANGGPREVRLKDKDRDDLERRLKAQIGDDEDFTTFPVVRFSPQIDAARKGNAPLQAALDDMWASFAKYTQLGRTLEEWRGETLEEYPDKAEEVASAFEAMSTGSRGSALPAFLLIDQYADAWDPKADGEGSPYEQTYRIHIAWRWPRVLEEWAEENWAAVIARRAIDGARGRREIPEARRDLLGLEDVEAALVEFTLGLASRFLEEVVPDPADPEGTRTRTIAAAKSSALHGAEELVALSNQGELLREDEGVPEWWRATDRAFLLELLAFHHLTHSVLPRKEAERSVKPSMAMAMLYNLQQHHHPGIEVKDGRAAWVKRLGSTTPRPAPVFMNPDFIEELGGKGSSIRSFADYWFQLTLLFFLKRGTARLAAKDPDPHVLVFNGWKDLAEQVAQHHGQSAYKSLQEQVSSATRAMSDWSLPHTTECPLKIETSGAARGKKSRITITLQKPMMPGATRNLPPGTTLQERKGRWLHPVTRIVRPAPKRNMRAGVQLMHWLATAYMREQAEEVEEKDGATITDETWNTLAKDAGVPIRSRHKIVETWVADGSSGEEYGGLQITFDEEGGGRYKLGRHPEDRAAWEVIREGCRLTLQNRQRVKKRHFKARREALKAAPS